MKHPTAAPASEQTLSHEQATFSKNLSIAMRAEHSVHATRLQCLNSTLSACVHSMASPANIQRL